MVEMLGVLAIIGVLSVGAIAGYQKAMLKYKLNKQAQQLSQVVNAVARYSRSFDDVSRSITSAKASEELLIKLGEIPKEMIINTSAIYDVFNSRIQFKIYPIDNNKTILLNFSPDITKKSQINLEICRNIMYILKENAHIIYYVALVSNHNLDNAKNDAFYGNENCTSSRVCLQTMTQEQIYNACTNHYNQKKFWFDIWFP